MHSKEQMRKKEEAMAQSREHHMHATVTGMWDGKDHEAHKMGDMARGSRGGKEDEIMNGGGVGGGV